MNKRIIRVFPFKTSHTPDDNYSFIGEPPGLLIPAHDEVHISCTFTWDKPYCEDLKFQWEAYTDKPVKIGGVAYGSPTGDFIPGLYIKSGIIFTSRGCNNNCKHCAVSEREGTLRELPITEGNIIQDNNFLQTSKKHKDAVFQMLRSQRGICFKGGLQSDLIDDHFIRNIQQLRIKEIWLACDTDDALPSFIEAAGKLTKAGFNRNKIHAYALIGDDMEANTNRLQEIYRAGAMPFAQLYQPIHGEAKLNYSDEWRKFHRSWCRPAAIAAHMEKGTDFRNFNT